MGTGWLWLLLCLRAAYGAAVSLEGPARRAGDGSDLSDVSKAIDLNRRASGEATNVAVGKETEKSPNTSKDTKTGTSLNSSNEFLSSDNLSVSRQGSQTAGSDPSPPIISLSKSNNKNSDIPKEGIADSEGIRSQNPVLDSESKKLKEKEKSSIQNKKGQHKLDAPESTKVEEEKAKEKKAENSAPDPAVQHLDHPDNKEESSDQTQTQPDASTEDISHKIDLPESNKVEEEKANFKEKPSTNSVPDSSLLKSNTKDTKQKEESSVKNQKAQPSASSLNASHKIDLPESNKVEEEKANSEENEAKNSVPDSSLLKSNTKDSKEKEESSIKNENAQPGASSLDAAHKIDLPESNKVEDEKANSEESEAIFPAIDSEAGISSGLGDGTKNSEKHLEGMPKDGPENSHFFAYLVTTAIVVAALYIAYHNKRKIIAFALEGKKAKLIRRPKSSDYQRLDQKI